MKHRDNPYAAVEGWLGLALSEKQADDLKQFERWLIAEALPSGGIGPHEADRMVDRHIMDSLAYVTGLPPTTHTVVDVGGGVGLPSIPMAITLPHMEFTLVERSGRRTDLARRAARILGLANYSVVHADIGNVASVFDVAVFRASLPIPGAAAVVAQRVRADGTGLLGVSRRVERPTLPSAPKGVTFALSSVGDRILESPFWLLTMRREPGYKE